MFILRRLLSERERSLGVWVEDMVGYVENEDRRPVRFESHTTVRARCQGRQMEARTP